MEPEPQDAARFDELSRQDAELIHQIDVVQASDSSYRVKKIRLKYIRAQMEKNLQELDALANKYEALKEKQNG